MDAILIAIGLIVIASKAIFWLFVIGCFFWLTSQVIGFVFKMIGVGFFALLSLITIGWLLT